MELKILPCGDRTVLAEYGSAIDPAIAAQVRAFSRALRGCGHPGILHVIPSYRSAMVEYDPVTLDWDGLLGLLHAADRQAVDLAAAPAEEVRVPVAYGGEFGPDMADVCAHAGLSEAEVVARHSGTAYLVYCVGYTAGFPFLGGLDPALALPRLSSPRLKVPAGAVGIVGQQTGVYPMELPGGWRIIGRTPVPFFNPQREPPGLVQAGDYLRFYPVTPAEYQHIAQQVAAGAYHVERTKRL